MSIKPVEMGLRQQVLVGLPAIRKGMLQSAKAKQNQLSRIALEDIETVGSNLRRTEKGEAKKRGVDEHETRQVLRNADQFQQVQRG